MSREILTTERVRLFAKRARSYVCAYYQLHHSGINDHDILDANLPEKVKIERLAKKYKTHRSAVDFNAGFITNHKCCEIDSSVTINIKNLRIICTSNHVENSFKVQGHGSPMY